MTLEIFGVAEANRRGALRPDSVEQRSVTATRLATEYGFTDLDGTQPDAWSAF